MANEIYSKLLKCQLNLKSPKSQFNRFGNFAYRSCEDILEAAKPVMNEYGATVLLSDEIELIGERYYVKATATFVDVETGESISVTACAREEMDKKGMDASQITGSASSYARKYALNGLFDIDDSKDADPGDNGKQADKVTKAQALEITNALKAKFGAEAKAKLKEITGYKTTTEIPADKFTEIMGKLK